MEPSNQTTTPQPRNLPQKWSQKNSEFWTDGNEAFSMASGLEQSTFWRRACMSLTWISDLIRWAPSRSMARCKFLGADDNWADSAVLVLEQRGVVPSANSGKMMLMFGDVDCHRLLNASPTNLLIQAFKQGGSSTPKVFSLKWCFHLLDAFVQQQNKAFKLQEMLTHGQCKASKAVSGDDLRRYGMSGMCIRVIPGGTATVKPLFCLSGSVLLCAKAMPLVGWSMCATDRLWSAS